MRFKVFILKYRVGVRKYHYKGNLFMENVLFQKDWVQCFCLHTPITLPPHQNCPKTTQVHITHVFVPPPKFHHAQNFAPKSNNCNLRDKHYLCVHTACPCPAQPGELLSNFPLPGRPQRRISVKLQIEECLRTLRTPTNVKIYCLQCP